MNPSLLFSKIDSHVEVRRYLEWHFENSVPLRLMFDSSEGHLPAYLVSFDAAAGTMDVVCMGARNMQSRSNVSYAIIGSNASGARFLASGQMSADMAEPNRLKLSFPECLDVFQTRDYVRCLAHTGHFLHFSSLESSHNAIVCKISNVSLRGLAVEWDPNAAAPSFAEGTEIENVTLHSRKNQIHLGKLRVAHITHVGSRYSIGLMFDRDVPKEFDSLVLDLQRRNYLFQEGYLLRDLSSPSSPKLTKAMYG